MDKPGGHRTGLNAHFGVDTSVLRNTSRNWPGIGGADAAPEPLALRVDNADRGRLLRYVQPNIMRHRNLRWCKSPGNMPGSRHYRCLRLRTAITRGPHHHGDLPRPHIPSLVSTFPARVSYPPPLVFLKASNSRAASASLTQKLVF